MKYTRSNKPLVCMQTQSTCYKGTRTMAVKGVLWHSTGANNPPLKRYVQPSDNAADREVLLSLLGKNAYGNDWNHIEHQAGLNCWIGKLADGTVAAEQTMPWDYRPWGCGSGSKGSCNDGWIQFEICEDDLTDAAFILFVFNYGVEETFTPELRQHLQHVDADLLRIVIQTGADDAEPIRCQYPAMQLVGLVLLVLPYSLFDICFMYYVFR